MERAETLSVLRASEATIKVVNYYLARHKAICALLDDVTKPGNHKPGAVECYQRDLRGIEDAIAKAIAANGEACSP